MLIIDEIGALIDCSEKRRLCMIFSILLVQETLMKF